MAISTDAWYQNSIQGVPGVGGDADVFEMHKLPRHALGHKLEKSDGRVFRYTHFGADTTQGKFVAQDISETGFYSTSQSDQVLAPASCQNTSDCTTGSHFVEMLFRSATANALAGGYFVVNDDTGEGYMYRIRGNTVAGDPATGNTRIELYEPLVKALDATSNVGVIGCKWHNVESATIETDNILAGVSCSNMDVSVKPFGWVQTKGPCVATVSAEVGSTPSIGDAVAVDTALNYIKKWGGTGTGLTTNMIAQTRVGTVLLVGTGQALIELELE